LSEVAALPIADADVPLFHSLCAMLTILLLEIILTFLKNKCHFLKRILEDAPSFLVRNGKPIEGELERTRMSIEELIGECRAQGYGDLSEIAYAILEQDGQLSILPRAEKAPLCPADISLPIKEKGLSHPVITDGHIHERHLRMLGLDRQFIEKECRSRGTSVKNVFLMTINDAKEIKIVNKEKKKKK
jgi:uncharacterized membrane protein YcaP (DUF421 family)